jgi:hypothetical protein
MDPSADDVQAVADANHLAALQQLVLGFADASATIRNAVAEFFHHDSRLHHHTVRCRCYHMCHVYSFHLSFLEYGMDYGEMVVCL